MHAHDAGGKGDRLETLLDQVDKELKGKAAERGEASPSRRLSFCTNDESSDEWWVGCGKGVDGVEWWVEWKVGGLLLPRSSFDRSSPSLSPLSFRLKFRTPAKPPPGPCDPLRREAHLTSPSSFPVRSSTLPSLARRYESDTLSDANNDRRAKRRSAAGRGRSNTAAAAAAAAAAGGEGSAAAGASGGAGGLPGSNSKSQKVPRNG
jgi:hypothetical protein